jgi:hypothetical protein
MTRSNLGLRSFARSLSVAAREFRVHAIDRVELPVSAHVVRVGMRIEYDRGQTGQFGRYLLDVADAHAGIELEGALLADD